MKDSLKASPINSYDTVAYSTTTELEALLILCGALDPPKRGPLGERRSYNDEDSEEENHDDDPSSRMRSAAASTNARAPRNIRGQKKDDSDSEFEFDM